MSNLKEKRCVPCEGSAQPLTQAEAKKQLSQLKGWNLESDGKSIWKEFQFKNYDQTIAFVNATAFISNQEDHHPDLLVTYNTCRMTYSTHAIKGLSDNDFICAAKVDALL